MNKKEWETYVLELQKESDILQLNHTTNEWIKIIINLLTSNISNLDKSRKYAVLLSGGVDSTILLKIMINLQYNLSVYSLDMGGDDIKFAREFCQTEKINLIEIKPTEIEFKDILQKTIDIQKTDDVTTIGIALVSFLILNHVKEEYFVTGLGAEEIFAGYQRHLKAKDLTKECWRGLRKMYEIDLIRENKTSKHFNKIAITPFLDKQLIIQGMHTPNKLRIHNGFRKYILSLVAKELEIPFFDRKKKAAQYGSGVQKQLEKTTKKAGFNNIKDYLKEILNRSANI